MNFKNNEKDQNNNNLNKINIIEKKENSIDKMITTEDIINYISSNFLAIIQKNKQIKKSLKKVLMSLFTVNSFQFYLLKNF